MRNTTAMRERIAHLRQQAVAFREFAETSKSEALREQLVDLAGRCDKIAANIARNLPIHERCD